MKAQKGFCRLYLACRLCAWHTCPRQCITCYSITWENNCISGREAIEDGLASQFFHPGGSQVYGFDFIDPGIGAGLREIRETQGHLSIPLLTPPKLKYSENMAKWQRVAFPCYLWNIQLKSLNYFFLLYGFILVFQACSEIRDRTGWWKAKFLWWPQSSSHCHLCVSTREENRGNAISCGMWSWYRILRETLGSCLWLLQS